MTERVRIAVIGAGFAGLGMAAQLHRHGIDDVLVLERADDVGGVWRANTYPGAQCDIRSDLYSFSFAPNPAWSRAYSPQPEILDYLHDVVRRFDLTPHIRCGTELLSAAWNESAGVWRLETSGGPIEATVLVSGAGPLVEAAWPDIPGLDSFAGPRFHSAAWRHDVDLVGAEVAVIGTGASAIQFVPELQKIAGRVTVYQRSAPWVLPRRNTRTSALRRRWFARHPAVQRAARSLIFARTDAQFAGFRFTPIGRVVERMSLRNLARQVPDAGLRDRLTPRFRIGCKRILLSSAYYPAITRPNVELVVSSIVAVEGDEVVTADGARRRADVLIAGTGFIATRPPVAARIRGRDGVLLADRWSPHMAALRGTTVAGFPNLFLLIGPNTVFGHNSMVYVIEKQIGYVLQALRALGRQGARSLEPRADAQARYTEKLRRRLRGAVWSVGGCTSFYLDEGGVNTTVWPGTAVAFGRALRHFDPAEYLFTP
ncbi:flavin-containing monooxygenase [Herbiconiux ginsengi]|uniref:Predicted flavoprotein CzcO associated with the cation diffusion facilitator CzcD n=1 Tax=Herbiconiux ginsengi TaxID=381665 RepID=A0A1H3Q824_9MICO|nr:NAD(P)/FAD-dependent oxidoreductase [Herbiconiux ginsengi]SDZ09684.1 Predicted flavoprotein CzcO associated with the cation diffusion facilitator CzcD [Herbiconiux ginsengi]